MTTVCPSSAASSDSAGQRHDCERPRRGRRSHLDDRGVALLGVLDEIAAAHDVPVAAVSLAWLAAQPTVAAPIASARTTTQLGEFLPALTLQLSDDELARLGRS